MRLSKLIEECKLPGEVKDFLKMDIFINAIHYYEVKKWAAKQKEKIEKDLDQMEEQGIITKVIEPTEWVNSITYPVKPNGDLCICLDPKDLNKGTIREHYKAPTLEEITYKLNNAKKFSKGDTYKGFFTFPMDYESSLKKNFNTIPHRDR